MGAPPGPLARKGAVWLGVAGGVDGAAETRDPAEPQAASERIARNTRTRIPTKVVGSAGRRLEMTHPLGEGGQRGREWPSRPSQRKPKRASSGASSSSPG